MATWGADAQRLSKREPLPKSKKARRKKLAELAKKKPASGADRVDWDLQKVADYQARCAKRARKHQRMRAFGSHAAGAGRKVTKGKSKGSRSASGKTRSKGSAFTKELTNVKKARQYRAGK